MTEELQPIMNTLHFFMATLLAIGICCDRVAEAASPSRYDVTWNSPSIDANGSMPLGNGDIGLNAWIDTQGDLVAYISKTDAWGDNARLLKIGRVRITFDPPLPTNSFRQTLCLNQGTMKAVYGTGGNSTTVRLWVDANHPVINVAVDGKTLCTVTASLELWRTDAYELPSIEISDVHLDRSKPKQKHAPTIVEPDAVLENLPDRIGWYHHNVKSVGPTQHAKTQGMTGYKRPDPLLHRTFGAIIKADGASRLDDTHLQSPRSNTHRLSIFVLTKHPSSPQQWLTAMEQLITDVDKQSFDERSAVHKQWWIDFWNRSWIDVTAKDDKEAVDDALVVSRGYALQRFISACAGRGRYPIKFNGSIFTVPSPDKPGDADYRRWGPGYWWQNTRLPYLSICASGDFEMMEPLLRMYVDDILPLARYRTHHYFGHGGAYYPECIHFWGDVFNQTYGWTPFEDREDKLQTSGWHKWEWVCGPELVFMLLDYYDHTLDQGLLKDRLLPTAHEVLTFFDEHYSTDDTGKLVMHPAQALETWWDCTNPMPEIAGLHAITTRLLALPERLTTPKQRQFWKTLLRKLPPLPTRMIDEKLALAPADRFADKRNIENPELYAVFPFRLVAFEKENSALGLVALQHRENQGNIGWRQDEIFMAYLGLADEAKQYLIGRARNHHTDSRFPAFWGPNYDWIPDQDHGSVLQKTLQVMLLQSDPYSQNIYLLPAWPKDWNVSFKLHAPQKTVIACTYRDGKIVSLKVTPESRRNDIVLP
jgi:alpha-L-fucosidase 2